MAKGKNRPRRSAKKAAGSGETTLHGLRVKRKKERRAANRDDAPNGGKPVTKTGSLGIPLGQKLRDSYVST